MAYIRLSQLQREQNQLNLNLVDYDLSSQWNSHTVIKDLRKRTKSLMPSGLFDPQDLEHQVLFRLTTYRPQTIDDSVIQAVINEQLTIINKRLEPHRDILPYLLRGLGGISRDLNVDNRLELKLIDEKLVALGDGIQIEVEFKKIDDPELVQLFTEKLHYIHSKRSRGDAFGFYFKGDRYPWGIETIEPSILAKRYKKDALLAHGIDPNKAVEITRLYLLPGSPKNAISIIDSLISKYYKKRGVEAMFTTTMPTYAKTRGATTAGGMKNVLLIKEQRHKFIGQDIEGKVRLVHAVGGIEKPIKYTHKEFPTLYTVETFMRLKPSKDIKELAVLKNKVILIDNNARNDDNDTIKEAKFKVKSVADIIDKLDSISAYVATQYLHDHFWGSENGPKIRLRGVFSNGLMQYHVSQKYKISEKNHIRTEITNNIYIGNSMPEAIKSISKLGSYAPENSYEKVRIIYKADRTDLRLDICPFGTFLEIQDEQDAIWEICKKLGLKKEDSTTKIADDIYVEWAKSKNLEELWHVNFGLDSLE